MITSEAVRVPLPTPYGVFDVHAFERASGHVYVAMVLGDVDDGEDVLVRLHSECLTGDALGSLRCDCGIQLRLALRTIAAEQRGVLVYATGHEGRGIGLVNKLRAYVAQDEGADTVDANVVLGLPIDSRDYTESAAVFAELGIRSVRLLTNNPHKVDGLRSAGTVVDAVVPLATTPHHRNIGYLNTKAQRLDHVRPTGLPLPASDIGELPTDAMALLGPVRPGAIDRSSSSSTHRRSTGASPRRPAIRGGSAADSERRMSHALRAACDGVMVGVGTVIRDDPELTVRMVSGASPMRIVLDTTLRIPADAKILGPEAMTTVITTERSDPARRAELRRRGVRVEVVAEQRRSSLDPGRVRGLADIRYRVGPGRGRLRRDHGAPGRAARRSADRRRRTDRDRGRYRGRELPRRAADRRGDPPREPIDRAGR